MQLKEIKRSFLTGEHIDPLTANHKKQLAINLLKETGIENLTRTLLDRNLHEDALRIILEHVNQSTTSSTRKGGKRRKNSNFKRQNIP